MIKIYTEIDFAILLMIELLTSPCTERFQVLGSKVTTDGRCTQF